MLLLPPNTHTLIWVTPTLSPTTAAEASRHVDCPLKWGCSSTDTNDQAHEDHTSITVRTRYCHQEQSGTL